MKVLARHRLKPPAPILGRHATAGGAALPALETLLVSGGDTRLALDPASGLNIYGCRPQPWPEAVSLASSTSSSISERAWRRAVAVRQSLAENGPYSFEAHLDHLRRALGDQLGLRASGSEIIFAPSGTDAALIALAVARATIGTPLVSVLVAADETGSGAQYATTGRHFNNVTVLGRAVVKGEPIAGLADGVTGQAIPLRDSAGRLRSARDMDGAVLSAVAAAIASGQNVLLHAMDHSKLGNHAPSLDCLAAIGARHGSRVLIAVDACQGRLGRARLDWHLARGHMVLVTGSKFFTGPPLSGALLVPAALAATIAAADETPAGLRDYSVRSDWPSSWRGLRAQLGTNNNFGQYFRWVAAVEEMRAYFAVPTPWRQKMLGDFATAVAGAVAERSWLEPLAPSEPAADDDMATQTIFPFFIRHGGAIFSLAQSVKLYRALNQDVTGLLPAPLDADERRLAMRSCHIGQPVAIAGSTGATQGALRISASARFVSDGWGGGADAVPASLQHARRQIGIAFDKIGLLLRHWDAIDRAF
jgi:hypothetical protein